MTEEKPIKNIAKCTNCNEVIESIEPHDWVSCTCWKQSRGVKGIWIDGGTGYSYTRRGGKPEHFARVESL